MKRRCFFVGIRMDRKFLASGRQSVYNYDKLGFSALKAFPWGKVPQGAHWGG